MNKKEKNKRILVKAAGIACRIAVLLLIVLAISSSRLFTMQAEAGSKKRSSMTDEEKHVIALTEYRDMLIKQGASAEEIEYANKAIELEQAKVDAQKAQKEYEAQVKAMQKSGSKNVVFPIIFVGDSRMVQMHEAMGNTGVLYIAENAKGYDWFVEKAIPQIDSACGKGSRIVINLGVNDTGNADKYVAMVNAKAIEWKAKGAKVYYALVNPVWDNPYTSEDQVVNINKKLVSGLAGVNIIDTHTFLVNNGYRLVDGLHYDGPTYASLYSFILSSIL